MLMKQNVASAICAIWLMKPPKGKFQQDFAQNTQLHTNGEAVFQFRQLFRELHLPNE